MAESLNYAAVRKLPLVRRSIVWLMIFAVAVAAYAVLTADVAPKPVPPATKPKP